jgi:hypothetical protein
MAKMELNLEMHLEAMIWATVEMPSGAEMIKFRDVLGGCDRPSMEMQLEARIDSDCRCSWRWSFWRQWIERVVQRQIGLYLLVKLTCWEYRKWVQYDLLRDEGLPGSVRQIRFRIMQYFVYAVLGICLVLSIGPRNPPGVRFLAGGSVRIGSVPAPKHEPLCIGGVVTRTEPKPCVFGPGRNRTASLFCGSYIFGSNYVFEFWSYHDMMYM